MSQNQATDLVIDPFTTSGQQLAAILNRLHAALVSMHSGAARPPYAVAGTIWMDTSTPPGTLMWYDGTTDHPLIGGPDTVPKGGTPNQILSKVTGTDYDFAWDGVKPGSYSEETMTGKSAITIDCSQYDTFDFRSIDTNFKVTFGNYVNGQTIVMVFRNKTKTGITFSPAGIRWPDGGKAPKFTTDTDTVVVTFLATNAIVGSYSVGQK